STLFFTALDDAHPGIRTLWKSDGSEVGTVFVSVVDATNGADIDATGSLGSTLYFSADSGGSGFELWKSNGTDAGTVLIKDINPSDGSSPQHFTALGANIYF